jgi:hypothetical protein
VIEAIRSTGAQNIIVLDEHVWGQSAYDMTDPDGFGSAVLNKGPLLNTEFDNLLYSLHPYGWTDADRMLQYVLDCHERELALIYGEYGAAYNAMYTHHSTRHLYNAAIPNRIGRLYWSWSGDAFRVVDISKTPGAVEGSGFEIDIKNGIDKPTNLTWFGELVWDDCHGVLTAPVPMP